MSPKTNVPAEEERTDYLPGVNIGKCFEVLEKGLKFGGGYDKETFPELPSFIFYTRLCIGVVLGIVCGIVPVTGAAALISCLTISGIGMFVYYSNLLRVNVESYGAQELLTEGLMPSIAIFVLTWVLTYNNVQKEFPSLG